MHRFFLIRHGESQSNAGLATADPKDVELTSRGHEQARQIAAFLKEYTPLNLIVTSSYLRTKQTAEPTKPAFPFVREDEWPVHEFTYLAPSLLVVSSTVEDRRPLVDGYWGTCDPSYVDGPGSESFEQFIERVREVIKRLKETSYKTIAIFSHEQFIRAVLWLSQGDPEKLDSETMRDFRDLLRSGSLPNGAILLAQFADSQESWQWELITSHLLPLGVEPL